MIIDPDFPDHWKTRLLVELLDADEAAIGYVIRLWAHCQQRQRVEFANLSQMAIKLICHFKGDAARLDAALSRSGFTQRHGSKVTVCDTEFGPAREVTQQARITRRWERILDVTVDQWRRLRNRIIERDGNICTYCVRAITGKICVDHMIPITRGGRTTPDNLCVSCKPCNSQKGARTPLEFIAVGR